MDQSPPDSHSARRSQSLAEAAGAWASIAPPARVAAAMEPPSSLEKVLVFVITVVFPHWSGGSANVLRDRTKGHVNITEDVRIPVKGLSQVASTGDMRH